MSWISSLAGTVTSFTATLIVAVAIHVPFLMHALLSVSYVPPTQTHTEVVATTSANVVHKYVPSVEPPPIISSSTPEEVGQFTVVVNCSDFNPVSVDVMKNGIKTQTLGLYASVSGVQRCPSAERQDINFDGYPDFMVLSDDGSGGAALTYWLYSTSTQQFYCSDPHNDCSLMNPEFYPNTKTVISWDQMGAGSADVQAYGVTNGNLNLLKDVQGSPTIIGTLETEASSTGF